MSIHSRFFAVTWLLFHSLVCVALGYAASTPQEITICYSSFSVHDVPLWIAVDDRLGKKYGLALKAVYAGRARPQQLLMRCETPFFVATVSGALTSHVFGVEEQ